MAETPKQTPSNVAENVLNRTVEASKNTFKAGADVAQTNLDRAAEVSSTALSAAEKVSEQFKTGAEAALQSAVEPEPVSVASLQDAGDEVGKRTSEVAERGAGVLDAYASFGTRTLSVASELTRAWTDLFSRQLANTTELSQRALSLRTPQDVVEFHALASDRAQANFAEINAIYSRVLDGMTQTWRSSTNLSRAIA